jgi:glucuronokinase
MGLERCAYARVGLLGNPSDVYNGKALSFTIADFSATVRLRPSPELLIQPHPHHDLVAFPSLPHLVSSLLSSLFFFCQFFYMSILPFHQ